MKNIKYDNYYWQNELVRLRAMEPKDWEEHYYNCFDSKARRMLQYELELPPTVKENMESIEKFSYFSPETGRIMFTVENLYGENVGGANINSVDERNGTFSIGMQIGVDYRAKGYGTAAMRILLDYAFNERRLNKFNVSVLDGNIGSSSVLKKLGCINEGVIRQNVFTEGKFKDVILFGLTRDEFNKNRI
ncbi:MAG: GNAT family N-acetyltransferase [Thermotogae bacterium]|nr:GNAT family N-acetyltransferase [Thermotogota bacterium]MCP5465680.1 GNAT family N-acetyltransferase [Thermotogota bacterium]HOO75139.1 GNAT family protein [Tepiditoga sp.]